MKVMQLYNSVFRKNDFQSLRKVKRELDSDITPDELLHWIDDNVPKKYEGRELFAPMNRLSKPSISNFIALKTSHID